MDDYLSANNNLTFDDIMDLELNIATTDSVGAGGNPWKFVEGYFTEALTDAGLTDTRQAALDIMDEWDGHFVAGGMSEWASGTDRADGWMLMDAWIKEVIDLTFDDEFANIEKKERDDLFINVLLHGLAGDSSGIVNNYNWFQNLTDENMPQTANAIIVKALDNVLADLGDRPWGIDQRGTIDFNHSFVGKVHEIPRSSRSTYVQCVEIGPEGPIKIKSGFPLGVSGTILMQPGPTLDDNFLSMSEVYDDFTYRDFPLFED